MPAFPEIDSLNPAQRDAVLHSGGPLLILAGAGSGKTRVITVKIAYLIRELGVSPQSILAVTFTNKAAAEMRDRAASIEPAAENVMIRTFHSFGAWLLRRNADAANLDRGYSIYDDDDVVSLLRTLFEDEHRGTLATYARSISRAKDYALRPSDDLSPISADPDFADIYRAYQERLDAIGNVDFGDLILKPVELLRDNPVIRTRIQQRYRYILVDEYQDSNVAQYELLKSLADESAYVCVVGDDDQSIYRFRGAEVRNILTFAESFPGTTVVKLEQNYRSTGPILDVASSVVKNNTGRLGKTLWTERKGGPSPTLALLRDQDEEVEYCLRLIRHSPRDTAILYRTNAQSRLFETALLREGIGYRIVGSLRFYDREEVKDALSTLKLVANPRDEVAFRRIINKPTRGIGGKSVETILSRLPDTRGECLLAAEAAIGSLSKKAGQSARRFLDVLQGARTSLGSGQLSSFSEQLIKDLGLWDYHKDNEDEITARTKVENLEEFVSAATDYLADESGLAEFLELIELDRAREADEVQDAHVTLITMHNTKGLEFDRVIVTGLEEGLFPRSGDENPDEIEEERRLFYVAVTRARDELYLTSVGYRRLHGRSMDYVPSRFVGEIPRDLIQISGDMPGPTARESSEYKAGTYVYHDDYGTGVVTKCWHNGSELVVQVQFENGRVARFLPKYTTLEKVAGDVG